MTSHILIADDDPGIRETIEAVLEEEGYDVTVATNGQEALEQISPLHPAVVLLDLNMPLMTGWEVTAQLRALGVRVPLICMTAGHRAQTEAERHGVDGYLAKPFDLDELIEAVQRFATPHRP